MDHRSVAHAFAHGQHAKGCNMYTDGQTIWSYGRHFPMACFVAHVPNTVLFNSNSYSVSTSKHQSYTRYALSGNGYQIFEVPYVNVNPTNTDHANNLEYLASQCSENRSKAFRARIHGQSYQSAAWRFYYNIKEYIEIFNVSNDVIPEIVSNFLNQFKDGLFTTKETDAFAEKERIAKEQYKELEKQRRIKRMQEIAESIQKFRNHEIGSIYDSINNYTFIRISKDGSTVQTSRGISVPETIVKRLYRLSKTTDIAGQIIEDINGIQYRINKYNGEFRAGCHTIQKEEIEALAQTQGW